MAERETDTATCPECGDRLKNEHGLKVHYAQTHEGTLVQPACDKCDFRTELKAELAEHNRKEHFDGVRRSDDQCPTCGLTFADERAVRIHHEGVHGESIVETTEFECRNCDTVREVPVWHQKAQNQRFCSRQCARQFGYGGRGIERVRRILAPDGTHWEEIAEQTRETADGTCDMCGDPTPTHGRPGLQTHHLLPLRSGGTHAEWNLWALCPSCHGKAEAFANSHFKRYLWVDEPCLMTRGRNKKGQFEPMKTSAPD